MAKRKGFSGPTLDLHGKTTDQIFDLVDAFITKHQNKARVCIIPGKGTGKVKSEVLRYLKLGGYPWEYQTLENGQKNPGSLIVILD
ncbi:MAG: Smr/MutS family protein [Bdellovibrionales bacterium]|nr:Smr/MutS family protein [Bdellovibrionales bacterium]